MTTPIKLESADEAAFSAMVDHHERLNAELELRLAVLRDAVCANAPYEAAQASLVQFVEGDLLPHAAAEEASLYPVAAQNKRAELFVDSMVLEHRELERKAKALRVTATPIRALSVAEALAAVFAVHVVKENQLLLPMLSNDPEIHLATLLRDMHEHLTEPAATGPSSHDVPAHAAAEELDVRTLAHGARHEIILGRLQTLATGERLFLVNDHDPKPLRYQLDTAWPEMFDWAYVIAGPELWRIEITRLG